MTSETRPRLGASALHAGAADWPGRCRRLEEAGIDELSVADHLHEGMLPPMVALAAAAVVTDGISLSTMVLNNELRHPAVLANEVALVSELSGGRFTLGIGAGHMESEHDAIGEPLAPPAERIAKLEETVVALRALFAGETVTTSGPHLRLTELTAAPTPTHPVPLLVGGGARRVLEVAARHADIIGLTGFSHVDRASKLTHFTADRLAERLDLVRAMPRDREEPARFQALVQILRLTDDREAAAARLLDEWGTQDLDVEQALETPFLLFGTAQEVADQLHERTERFGIETWTVFLGRPQDASIEDVAAVAAALRR